MHTRSSNTRSLVDSLELSIVWTMIVGHSITITMALARLARLARFALTR